MSDWKEELEVGTCDQDNTCEDLPLPPADPEPSEEWVIPMPSLTYGEKAVWLTFNPGWLIDVTLIKEHFAAVIDLLNNTRTELRSKAEHELMTTEQRADNWEKQRLLSVAITEAQTAQMWAVKAITFNLK